MRVPYYQVDAFAKARFQGNPAGVCVLEAWLTDDLLQAIATENGLSETAFCVRNGKGFDLRWFTPAAEVDLCGHATLAAAHVLFSEFCFGKETVCFNTKSGVLAATRGDGMVELDFPSRPPVASAAPEPLLSGLGGHPQEVLKSRDYLVLYGSVDEVSALKPDMTRLAQVDSLGVIVTARGNDVDFVSRFFAPRVGVPEDPVTGSAHSTLIPFWAARLGKSELVARQLSRRGGELHCRLLGDRVGIAGKAIVYSRGEIEI